MLNILTIDLEEWYHPEYVRNQAGTGTEDRSFQDLQKTFELLEKHNCLATFFVVGEIAEKHPELIRQIERNSYEIAFHGYNHEPLTKKNPETLQLEIDKFRALVDKDRLGFRAPSFSLNNDTKWALDVLEKNEFKYDSSIFPASTPLYGVKHAPTEPYKPSHEDVGVEDHGSKLWEFPLHVSTIPFIRIPMAGGFYIRFFPLNLLTRSIRKANRHDCPAVIYIHTWELNPETPKLKLGLYKSFVTYHNLKNTERRLNRILSEFEFTSIQDYMNTNGLL